MSVGAFLDRASAALAQASAQIQATPQPTGYDAAATITARDYLYQQLARFAQLTVGARATGPASAALSEAATRIGLPSGRHRPATQVLSSVLAGATLNLPQPARELLMAPGTAAAVLQQAAETLALAAEIVATHRSPASTGPRYLTAEGQALARGAQRPETIGEIARLLLMAMRMDTDLAGWRSHHPDVITGEQWTVLAQWPASGFPDALAQLNTERPAALLRELTPAAPAARPAGPREISSWADAIESVQATRAALRRDRGIGVAALTAATAFVGFAVTAAGWRLSGRTDPPAATVERGQQWQALATSMREIADARDALAQPYVAELDRVKRWIKQQVAGRTDRASRVEIQQLLTLEQQINLLCRDLAVPLRLARADGHLLTAHTTLDTPVHAGTKLAAVTWSPPPTSGGPLTAAMKALHAAADPRPPLGLRTTLNDLLSGRGGPTRTTERIPATPQTPQKATTPLPVHPVAAAFRATITEALLRARPTPTDSTAHRAAESDHAIER